MTKQSCRSQCAVPRRSIATANPGAYPGLPQFQAWRTVLKKADTRLSAPSESAPPDLIDEAERAWTTDTSADNARIYAVSTRILYVATLIEQSFGAQAQLHGMNTGEMLVLDALHRLGPPFETTPVRLRKQFFISFAGIGKRITKLADLGYIERTTHAPGRGSQMVRLSPAGLAVLRSSENGLDAAHTRALATMDGTEVEMLGGLLRNLQQRIQKATSAALPSPPIGEGE